MGGDLDAEGFEHLGGPGDKGLWTGLTWGSGGALTAVAMLLNRFGGVYVDVDARRAVGIDGVSADVAWKTEVGEVGQEIVTLDVRCALQRYGHTMERTVRARFGRFDK